MMFISVLLPEPDGPMMATYSPGSTASVQPRSAWTVSTPIWYVFHTSAMSMTGWGIGFVDAARNSVDAAPEALLLVVLRHRLVGLVDGVAVFQLGPEAA